MKYLKNISDEVINVTDLIKIRSNQVISLALTKTSNSDIRLFSLSKEEEIYNEKYEMDTIYLCLVGDIVIVENDEKKEIKPNDMVAISMDSKSHIVAKEDSIMLQIMVKE